MDEREMARSARAAQNLNLKLTIGFIVGAVLGLIVGAYWVLPTFGTSFIGIIAALASIFIGGLVVQRLVLNALS